jgi:hypothetical protein
MCAKKNSESSSQDPAVKLTGLIADARTSLREIEDSHTHTASLIRLTLSNIEEAASQAGKRSNNMKKLLKKWEALPRRGENPPLRLLVTTEIEGRGGLKISWAPSLSSYDQKQAFHALLMTELGPSENFLSIPRFRELAILMKRSSNGAPDHLVLSLRYTLWAGITLGRVLANSLGNVVPTAQVKDVDITLSGDINDKNIERELSESLTSWLENYDHTVPLDLLHHAHQAGMTPITLRDMCRRSGLKSVTLIDMIRGLKNIGEIVDYNNAWWRTGTKIPLPKPKGFLRHQ